MDAQAACRFFALLAELRKIIYGLAFSCSVSTEVELEHAESLAPSEVPLLCCRRFYKEVMGIWKEAARVFWFESVFTVNVAESQDHISATELSLAVFKHHVRCIRNIKITASLPGRPLDLLLESSRHEWNCWDVIPQRHPQDLPLPGRHFDTLMRELLIGGSRFEVVGASANRSFITVSQNMLMPRRRRNILMVSSVRMAGCRGRSGSFLTGWRSAGCERVKRFPRRWRRRI